MSFVLDASVALSWCLEDELHPLAVQARRALDRAPALVPDVWLLEVINGLLVAERRRRLEQGAARTLLETSWRIPSSWSVPRRIRRLAASGN